MSGEHYSGKVECITVIEQQELNFNLGNVLKYIWRAGKKTESREDDLRKALDYLHREIYGEWFKK